MRQIKFRAKCSPDSKYAGDWVEGGFVKPGGLFIAEMTSEQTLDISPAWELCRDRTYGQTRLAIYRRR